MSRGVQRGIAPLRYFLLPQEWGTKGVESNPPAVRRLNLRRVGDPTAAESWIPAYAGMTSDRGEVGDGGLSQRNPAVVSWNALVPVGAEALLPQTAHRLLQQVPVLKAAPAEDYAVNPGPERCANDDPRHSGIPEFRPILGLSPASVKEPRGKDETA